MGFISEEGKKNFCFYVMSTSEFDAKALAYVRAVICREFVCFLVSYFVHLLSLYMCCAARATSGFVAQNTSILLARAQQHVQRQMRGKGDENKKRSGK